MKVSILSSDYPPGRVVLDRDGLAVRLPSGRKVRVWFGLHWRLATWPRRVRHLCVCCGSRDTRTESGSWWCGLCKHGYCPRREQTGKECRR